MGNKQTAVEWLVNNIWKGEPTLHQKVLIEQAKQMEKEQMKLIYSPAIMQNEDGKFCVKTFEQYYKETYKPE